MRRWLPYVAVIADSFRAALSSRVLWIAFVAIWILIGALSPIGYREDYNTRFIDHDLENASRLKAMLAQGLVDPEQAEAPVGRIAAALPNDLKRSLEQVGQGEDVRIWFSTLSDGLNKLFADDSWYDAEAWSSTVRLRELRRLDSMASTDLSESLRERRTRLRIEAALPGVFRVRSARSILLTYFGVDFPARLAIDKAQFLIVLNQFVIPTIIQWLLGYILVFLGILVTASIIPDMLQPGSLHLLLSKPVSRSMLLLSKYVGGCAFMFLCVVQLVVGLYLVAGFRLDVWNARILLCIPVSVFVFAVFYSVSVLAGLRWRSPILAIGVTCMFGAFCIVVGVFGGLFDAFVKRPDTIKAVAISGDPTTIEAGKSNPQILAATRGGGLLRFDNNTLHWDEIYESEAIGADRMVPPVTLIDGSIATAHVPGGRMSVFGMGAFDLLLLNDSTNWRPQPSLRLPTATTELLIAGDELLAVNTNGVFVTSQQGLLDAIELEKSNETNEAAMSEPTSAPQPNWMAKLASMMGVPTDGFENILPSDMSFLPPRSLAVDQSGKTLALFSGNELVCIEKSEQEAWEVTRKETIDGDVPRFANVAISGPFMLLATDQPELQLFAKGSSKRIASFALPNQLTATMVVSLGDEGRFAILTSDQRIRILDTPEKVLHLTEPIWIEDVEAISYDQATDQFIVAHSIDRIALLDPHDFSSRRTIRPMLSTWRNVDRWLMTPLRTLTPQTGELGGMVARIISGETAIQMSSETTGPIETIRYRVFGPLLSCAIFIVVMLTLSCLYFARSDF
ncbi:ABC-2 family transporter protein [Novipirellula aureliae]|uniref:ABC-2 family transporter protein n=1 Tax=Novipirellula aureliae TaxID=2527966 RepID=A0A5C6DGG2_9BACT|nr:ABC transporter permease [Novipirellula aureliae]TWU34166.1 ABC-2 family transporter protein [Novipirellula aureliae]